MEPAREMLSFVLLDRLAGLDEWKSLKEPLRHRERLTSLSNVATRVFVIRN